jgi:two-component system response regulator YesN
VERLIIVDDDEVICAGLRFGIPWEEHGFTVAGTAYDGETALELTRRFVPEIVLLDIDLPFISGLELSEIIRQEYPEIKIILLTAYEEFHFAQKALKLHVYDYLTKPLDNGKVLEAVCNAKASLIEERSLKAKVEAGLPLIKEKYLYELVTGSIDPAKQAEAGEIASLSAASYFGIAILIIKNYYTQLTSNDTGVPLNIDLFDNGLVKRNIADGVKRIVDPGKVIVFNGGDDEIILLYKDFSTKGCCESYMDTVANQMHTEISKYDDRFSAISLGTAHWGFGGAAASYEEAKKSAEYIWHFENHSIIRPGEIDATQNRLDVNVDQMQQEIVGHLKFGRFDAALMGLETLFRKFKNATGIYFSYVRMVAVATVILVCKEAEEEYQGRFFLLLNNVIPQVIKIETLDDMEQWMKGILTEIVAVLAEKKKSGVERIIEQAVGYIHDCYANPDLTLDDVASNIHISPTYFSALFKQVKNVNFSDYLETVRMHKAMELFANTELKIYEVADRVGYNSPQYFSICFKKFTNFTPTEFRAGKN